MRLFISGFGLSTPLGDGVAQNLSALGAGKRASAESIEAFCAAGEEKLGICRAECCGVASVAEACFCEGKGVLEYAASLLECGAPHDGVLALSCFPDDSAKKGARNLDEFALCYKFFDETFWGAGCAAAHFVLSEKSPAHFAAEILACAKSYTGTGAKLLESSPYIDLARSVLARAGIRAENIQLVLWNPRGAAVDFPVIFMRDVLFGAIPVTTSVFNTGYMGGVSSLQTLACAAYGAKGALWAQRTQVPALDVMPRFECKYALCVESDFAGNVHMAVVEF